MCEEQRIDDKIRRRRQQWKRDGQTHKEKPINPFILTCTSGWSLFFFSFCCFGLAHMPPFHHAHRRDKTTDMLIAVRPPYATLSASCHTHIHPSITACSISTSPPIRRSELDEGVHEQRDAEAGGALAVVDRVGCCVRFGMALKLVGCGRVDDTTSYVSLQRRRTHVDVAPLPRLDPVAEVAPYVNVKGPRRS